MNEVQSRRRNPILVLAVLVGVGTVLVALGLHALTPGWSHAQRGAVLGGWIVFCLCMAPIVLRLSARKR